MGFAATADERTRLLPEMVTAARQAKAGRFKTRYWTSALPVGAFALPRFIADLEAPAK